MVCEYIHSHGIIIELSCINFCMKKILMFATLAGLAIVIAYYLVIENGNSEEVVPF